MGSNIVRPIMSKPTTKRRGSAVRARTAPRPAPTRPGRRHTKPLAVLYQEGAKRVCAMLIEPTGTKTLIEQGRGIHSALGLFMDLGYSFGSVRDDIPEWALVRIPKGCKPIGCANITSFPL